MVGIGALEHPARARPDGHQPRRVPGRHARAVREYGSVLRYQQLRRPATRRRQPQCNAGTSRNTSASSTTRPYTRGSGGQLVVYQHLGHRGRGAAGDPARGHRAGGVRADRLARRADHRHPVDLPSAARGRRRDRGAARDGRRPRRQLDGRAARHRGRRRGRGAAGRRGDRRAVAADLVRSGAARSSRHQASTWTGRSSGSGMLALALVLGGVAVAIAYRLAPHRAAGRIRAAAPGVRRVAAPLGRRAARLRRSRACGSRWSRAGAAPRCRSGRCWPGAVLAAAVVTATLTFAASLSTLISRPALYGWNFGYALFSVDGYGAGAGRVGRPAAAPRPAGRGRHRRRLLRHGPDRRPDGAGHGRSVTPAASGPQPADRPRPYRAPRDRARPGHPGRSCTSGSARRSRCPRGRSSRAWPAADRGHGRAAHDRRQSRHAYLHEHRGVLLHRDRARGGPARLRPDIRAERRLRPDAARG